MKRLDGTVGEGAPSYELVMAYYFSILQFVMTNFNNFANKVGIRLFRLNKYEILRP
jgi:hypothetical protein